MEIEKKYVKFEIPKNENNMKDLLCSITVPSNIHTYSVSMEYIKNWFLSKFKGEYFKHVHIDGKHVFDDFRKFRLDKANKLQKPLLSITPRINFEYNRTNLDINLKNMNLFFNKGFIDRAFYKNFENNTFLGLEMEMLEIQYIFRVKLNTRAQQVDLYKYMKMAFSIGTSETNYIDIDYHIPNYMILQIAKDNNFEIEDGKIKDIISFISFINSKSEVPVMCKYRGINGNSEFFIRFRDVSYHITLFDQLNADDGEREGQLDNNFNIEMNILAYIPTPRIYLYFSKNDNDIYVEPIEKDPLIEDAMTIQIHLTKIPEVNSKGWNQYLITEHLNKNHTTLIEEDISPLLKDIRIYDIVEANNKLNISSDIFIEFKIYNSEQEINYIIDWKTCRIKFLSITTADITNIAVYIDSDYIKKQLDIMGELKTRYKSI